MVLVILLFFCYTINSGGSMKKIIFLIFIILLSIFSYLYYNYENLEYYEEILKEVDNEQFNINNYSIFGTSLNIEGCINKNLNNASLVLKNKEKEIILDSTFYNEDNNTCFYINKYNNEGIYLDGLEIGDYILLVKDINEKEIIYYTLNNNTTYKDIEYYTITRNNKNNKINIKFMEYEEKKYVNFIISESKLPEDVYDISIDPGHGGKDPGAIGKLNGKEYYESNLTLNVSLLLKKELENIGFKVKLTRDSDIYLEPYGEGGRALIPNQYNTKYSFSIHFNSDYGIMSYGGVEVYTPNNIALTLPTIIANNLSDIVGYSKNNNYKLQNGVYYKYFKQKDIDESKQSMLENNMEPYNIILNSPYMYMIREVGGVNTHAYVDGRNDYYGLNKYYNANQTAEPYLLELAYINYSNDLNKIINNSELFSKAISDSIKEYLKIS